MDTNTNINDETFTLYYTIQYIKENFVGLLLLLVAAFIIYIVDYISRINALIYAMPSPVPGLPSAVNNIQMLKLNKSRKSKK